MRDLYTKVSKNVNRISKIKTRATSAVLLSGLFIAGFASSNVLASIPDTGGSVHGCYTTATLRIIDSATTSCTALEKPITWNQQGQAGGVAYHTNQVTVPYDDSTLANPVELLAIPGFATLSTACDSGTNGYLTIANTSGYPLELNGGSDPDDPALTGAFNYSRSFTIAPGQSFSQNVANAERGILAYKLGSQYKSVEYTLVRKPGVGYRNCVFTASALY